jgi:PAS domain S-box-containing protein
VIDDRASRIERQLASAQAITHIGSWEWDMATGVVTWSDELYRIYGFEPRSREITFDFFLSRLKAEDRERIHEEVKGALGRGGRFAYRERIVRPGGEVRQLDTVGEVVRDADGNVAGLIGTCRDVTEEEQQKETIGIYADIVRHAQIGLTVWEVGDPDDVGTFRLVTFNAAAEKVARIPLAPRVGEALLEIFPYARGGQLEALLAGVAKGRGVLEAAVDRSLNPRDPARAVALKAFALPGRRVGVAAEDTTEKTRARRLAVAEQRVLEMIASGVALPEILTALILAIEEHSPPTIGSILLLDPAGARLCHGAAPHLPESYNRAIAGLPIGPSAGSCGTATYEKRPVFVRDIETDPLWAPYRELARAHGLRACWSAPILSRDGRVLGTFAFYYREPRDPVPTDLELIARVTHVAGIAIEGRELEEQLRALSARAESVREEERAGIAREIHDTVGQALTALKMDIAWIARRLPASGPATMGALSDKLEAMSKSTDDVLNQVRRISSELRPGVLDDLGIAAALEWQGQEFEERTGTTCVIFSNVDGELIDRDVSTAVFRIFQEALTNVARHAEARRVEVKLERDGEWLFLEVRDDGIGIAPDAPQSARSLGVLGMRERARRLGGTARVLPAEGGGTVVSLTLPLAGGRST